MARRFHVRTLFAGDNALDDSQAHHAVHVLRLADGAQVELFDDAGAVAVGIMRADHSGAVVFVKEDAIYQPAPMLEWTIAAAVPKADRADWMVEKISELGATAFIPLAAKRSVVLPEGKSKRERWARIAAESAKQSRRSGLLRIDELTDVSVALQRAASGGGAVWFFSTEVQGMSVKEAAGADQAAARLTLFIGPEGGWTAEEIAAFQNAGARTVRLGSTILRTETAAVAAGAMAACLLARPLDDAEASRDDRIDVKSLNPGNIP